MSFLPNDQGVRSTLSPILFLPRRSRRILIYARDDLSSAVVEVVEVRDGVGGVRRLLESHRAESLRLTGESVERNLGAKDDAVVGAQVAKLLPRHAPGKLDVGEETEERRQVRLSSTEH